MKTYKVLLHHMPLNSGFGHLVSFPKKKDLDSQVQFKQNFILGECVLCQFVWYMAIEVRIINKSKKVTTIIIEVKLYGDIINKSKKVTTIIILYAGIAHKKLLLTQGTWMPIDSIKRYNWMNQLFKVTQLFAWPNNGPKYFWN